MSISIFEIVSHSHRRRWAIGVANNSRQDFEASVFSHPARYIRENELSKVAVDVVPRQCHCQIEL